jgi:hypothetical protein
VDSLWRQLGLMHAQTHVMSCNEAHTHTHTRQTHLGGSGTSCPPKVSATVYAWQREVATLWEGQRSVGP